MCTIQKWYNVVVSGNSRQQRKVKFCCVATKMFSCPSLKKLKTVKKLGLCTDNFLSGKPAGRL